MEAQWQFVNVVPEYTAGFKVYVVFLFTVSIVASITLIRAWIAAPPFRLSAKEHDAIYKAQLRISSASLKQWVIWTMLAYCILVATSLEGVFGGLHLERQVGLFTLTAILQDYAQSLTLTLWVILLVCVVRGHLLLRLERLNSPKNIG